MRVTAPTGHLLDAIGHAAAVASTKSTKPQMECVLLEATDGKTLYAIASDLDVGVRIAVPDAQIEDPGHVAVSAARLLSICREVEEDETVLVSRGDDLEIGTAGSRFRIRCESADEFPVPPKFPDVSAVQIDADVLREMVRRTAFAAARDAGRFALHGVQMQVGAGKVRMVATDGRRLAQMERAIEGKTPPENITLLVGPKALVLLERALGAGVGVAVDLALHERLLLLRSGNLEMASRLIDGSFPAVDGVIPRNPPLSLFVTAAAWAAGLRRAALLTTKDSASVEVEAEGNVMRIRSRARELGQADVEVAIRYDGTPVRVGLNPAYVQDVLKVMDPASEVRVGLTDGKAPLRISDCDEYVYVVSPVSLE